MTMVPLDDLAFISRASFGTMPHDGWLYGAILPSTFKDDDELDKSKSLRMAFVYPDFSTAIVGRFSPTGKKRMPWALNGGSGVPARLITLSCFFPVQSRHSAMSFPLPPSLPIHLSLGPGFPPSVAAGESWSSASSGCGAERRDTPPTPWRR